MNDAGHSQQRPTLGWLCSYTPVEIAWAAGYLPVRISGGEGLPRSQDPRIYHLLCPFVRAVFHRYASGEGSLPDVVVFVRCCDGMLRLHDVWKAYIGNRVHLVDLPKMSSPQAAEYFAHVLRAWGSTLAKEGPREITPDGLREAIQWMNQARSFFRGLIQAQCDRPALFTYGRVHAWVRQWLAEPTQQVLEKIRDERERLMDTEPSPDSRPRVLITSTMLDQPGLIRLIEEAGLTVVAEDECMGARHFDLDVPEEGDPFETLAERYLNKWPCSRMKGHDRRFMHLDYVMEEAGVQGIIALQLKYCDQSSFDLPLLKAHLEAKGMPFLIVENDYGEGSSGQLRTRIEAFAEMLHEPWT